MQLNPAIVFLAGLVIIILGAEILLRGASRIASMLGIQPIIIGLTVVSLGTSMPELAVGITAVSEGRGALAIGNIAGTNILNILFILGLSALMRPLPIRLLSIKLDVPVMVAAALALVVMCRDGVLGRAEGFMLLAAGSVYTIALVWLSRREGVAARREFSQEYGPMALKPHPGAAMPGSALVQGAWNALLLLVGIAVAVLGADLLVSGAVAIARVYSVSDAVIGLTIVAIGTSAPELATTLVATLKDDRDVAIGNLIGSSIYNILIILGLTSLAAPTGIDVGREILWVDLPLAAAVAIVCLPVFRSGQMVTRREGGLFVIAYLIYMASLLVLRT